MYAITYYNLTSNLIFVIVNLIGAFFIPTLDSYVSKKNLRWNKVISWIFMFIGLVFICVLCTCLRQFIITDTVQQSTFDNINLWVTKIFFMTVWLSVTFRNARYYSKRVL